MFPDHPRLFCNNLRLFSNNPHPIRVNRETPRTRRPTPVTRLELIPAYFETQFYGKLGMLTWLVLVVTAQQQTLPHPDLFRAEKRSVVARGGLRWPLALIRVTAQGSWDGWTGDVPAAALFARLVC